MNYQQNAINFANKYGVKLKINGVKYGRHFASDTENRYIFNCTISRNGKRYTFNFGQSIANGNQEPTIYDILVCFEKYGSNSFDDFCDEFGLSDDSISALKLYKAVQREFNAVNRLFGDIMEELQEIQ